MTKTTEPPQADMAGSAIYRSQALDLLEGQKTMVLAVSEDNLPWTAPVYYVYQSPALYFFSSPNSKHIQAVARCRQAAGAVYADSDRWQDIKGLQMVGKVHEVEDGHKTLTITARYLAKFPTALQLLASGSDKAADLRSRVRLYGFWPTEIHCTSNTLAFGRRVQIRV